MIQCFIYLFLNNTMRGLLQCKKYCCVQIFKKIFLMLKQVAIATQMSKINGLKACFHGVLVILALDSSFAKSCCHCSNPKLHFQGNHLHRCPTGSMLRRKSRQNKQKTNAPKATSVQRVKTCSRALYMEAAHSLG